MQVVNIAGRQDFLKFGWHLVDIMILMFSIVQFWCLNCVLFASAAWANVKRTFFQKLIYFSFRNVLAAF